MLMVSEMRSNLKRLQDRLLKAKAKIKTAKTQLDCRVAERTALVERYHGRCANIRNLKRAKICLLQEYKNARIDGDGLIFKIKAIGIQIYVATKLLNEAEKLMGEIECNIEALEKQVDQYGQIIQFNHRRSAPTFMR